MEDITPIAERSSLPHRQLRNQYQRQAADDFAFAAAQAAQKCPIRRLNLCRMFAAAQAAQKTMFAFKIAFLMFAAAQAAQKVISSESSIAARFAAAQAAQKGR